MPYMIEKYPLINKAKIIIIVSTVQNLLVTKYSDSFLRRTTKTVKMLI